MHRYLKLFGILTTIGMMIVLIQGALVTQTGSGDACGAEWPLCHGRLFPEVLTIPTLIEYTHRLVSAILGLMVVILAIWSWVKLKHLKETLFFAIIAVLFIIFQGLLGAAAVVWGQSDAVMALHFGFSLISFTSVLLLTILAFEDGKNMNNIVPILSRKMRMFVYLTLLYCYTVVYTGAYVRHTGSSGACSGWPLCNGQIIPDPFEWHVAIQFFHRSASGFLFIVILILFLRSLRYKSEHVFFRTNLIAFLLVLVQVISGALVIFTGLSIYATMFHAFNISLLFGALSYSSLLSFRSKRFNTSL